MAAVVLGAAVFTRNNTRLADVPLAATGEGWTRGGGAISKLVLGLHSTKGDEGAFGTSGVALAPGLCVGAADGRDCVAAVAVRQADANDREAMALAKLVANAVVVALTREVGALLAAFAREDSANAAAAANEYTAASALGNAPTPRGTPASATLRQLLDRFSREVLRPILARTEAAAASEHGAAAAFAAGGAARKALGELVVAHAEVAVRVHAMADRPGANFQTLASWPRNAPGPGALERAALASAADAYAAAEARAQAQNAQPRNEQSQLLAKWRADGRMRSEDLSADIAFTATSARDSRACCHVAAVQHGSNGAAPLLITVAVSDGAVVSQTHVAPGTTGAPAEVAAAAAAAVAMLSGRILDDVVQNSAKSVPEPLLVASPPAAPSTSAALGPRGRRLAPDRAAAAPAPMPGESDDLPDRKPPADGDVAATHGADARDPLPPRAETPTDPVMLIAGVRDLVASDALVAPPRQPIAATPLFTPSHVELSLADTPATAPRPPEAPRPSAGHVRRRAQPSDTGDDAIATTGHGDEATGDPARPDGATHARDIPPLPLPEEQPPPAGEAPRPKHLPALLEARRDPTDGDVLRHDSGDDAAAAASALLQRTYVDGTGLPMDSGLAARTAAATAGAPERG